MVIYWFDIKIIDIKNMNSYQDMNNFIHKSVTTRDGADLGNLIAVDQIYITVGRKIIFKFPIELVERITKNRAILSINVNDVYTFKKR